MGWAEALSGLGAGLSGNSAQWQIAQSERMKSLADLDEQRQKAMAMDLRGVNRLIKSGDIGGATQLLQNRLEHIAKLGGDPTHTANLNRMISEGRTEEASAYLDQVDQAAVEDGLLPSMAPKYSNFVNTADGRRMGFNQASGAYEEVPLPAGAVLAPTGGAGATMYSASNEFYDNGTSVQFDREGKRHVMTPDGREVTGSEAAKVLATARREQVDFAGSKSRAAAEGTATGTGNVGRAQGFVDEGVQAAKALPILYRTRDLLSDVETGGIDRALVKARTILGIESANEAELTANLGKAVLSQLRATFGAQFTEREGSRLEAIEAGFGKSTAGNKRLIEQLIKMSTKYSSMGIKAAERLDDYDSAQAIEELMNFDIGAEQVPERGASQAPASQGASTPRQATPKFLGFE